MAVYTEVTDEALSAFLEDYDIGRASSLKGHRRGRREFEFPPAHRSRALPPDALRKARRRSRPAVLYRPDGASGRQAASTARSRCAPRDGAALGRLAGRAAAIVTFLDGLSVRRPNAQPLRPGRRSARRACTRPARISRCAAPMRSPLEGWPALFEPPGRAPTKSRPASPRRPRRELAALQAIWPADLPDGVIHADLFPDNVFFLGDELSGLIDFYFACNDFFAYDLAVCLNAWCFELDGEFNVSKGMAMIEGYRAGAPPRARRGRGAAGARARLGAALHADAAGRLAQRAARRLGRAEESARISGQAALSPARRRARATTAGAREAESRRSGPTAPARAIPAPAAGAQS